MRLYLVFLVRFQGCLVCIKIYNYSLEILTGISISVCLDEAFELLKHMEMKQLDIHF